MKPINQAVSQRIAVLRTLLIMGIVLLHVPPAMMPSDIGGDPFGYFKYGLSRGFFRGSVPVLTCISGYLLFLDVSRFNYLGTVIGKTQRILFPLLLWNLPLVFLLYGIQRYGVSAHDFSQQLYPFDWWNFVNASAALTGAPVNYPLNFLRDLFILFLLSPIFLVILRKVPWIGFAAVCAVFLFNLDGNLILRNTMPVCFYLGGLCALREWDLTRLDRYWPLALSVLLTASIIIAAWGIVNVTWFRLISPPIIWIAAAPLVATRTGAWLRGLSGDSYFLFLSHGPLLLMTYVIYRQISAPIPYVVYWFLAPIVVCTFALGLRRVLQRYFPFLAAVAIGDFKAKRQQQTTLAGKAIAT